jgi:rhodanese-related sulfurtransferase
MNKLNKFFLAVFVLSLALVSGCKDNSEDPAQEFDILQNYLVTQGMDLPAILNDADAGKFVLGAKAESDVDGKYIIDIRSSDAFNGGHIDGAVNVPITDILTEAAKAGDKDILVVCYSGQTACFATSLLRLYGYNTAKALKWGMSGWNADLDVWSENCGDTGDGELIKGDAPANTVMPNPVVNTGNTTGDEILKARVEAVVKEWGSSTVGSQAVVDNPDSYFINNYFSEGHYNGFGHVNGALRIQPLKFADGSINYLDPTKAVVTYCYTGQTSAVITAYLRVLGYNAKSMVFGMNGMNTSNTFWTDDGTGNPVSNHWGYDSKPKDFSYIKN